MGLAASGALFATTLTKSDRVLTPRGEGSIVGVPAASRLPGKVRVERGVHMPTFAAFDQEKSELESVLSSGILERAPNLAHLLTYVCSKYFDGAGEQVKEYNIAVEALGRPPDFDQKKDSIVRVEAHKLRKRLRQYYKTEGADHPIHIEIPPGQYAPKFIFQHSVEP